MKKIFLILFIIYPTICYSNQDINFNYYKYNYVLQATYLSLVYVDYRQTSLAMKSENLSEQNYILGTKPSRRKRILFFSGIGITHSLLSYIIPNPYKTIFQTATLSLKVSTIYSNYKVGVTIKY